MDEQQLIIDGICSCKIYTDRHLPNLALFSKVFSFPSHDLMVKAIQTLAEGGMIYEWRCRAGQLRIHGQPTFQTCQFVEASIANEIWDAVEERKKKEKNEFIF